MHKDHNKKFTRNKDNRTHAEKKIEKQQRRHTS